jgi:peptide/nickel transport system permease protein/oligopeptide transport system permease protein
MLQFLVKRVIGLVFVLIGVTFITFIMGYFAPGDPIISLCGLHCTPDVRARLAHSYGLDLPWYQQYWNFATGILHGNFGLSFENLNQPVVNVVAPSLLVSAELGLMAFALTLLIGIPVGIIAALKHNTWIDTTSMGVMLFFYALPTFVLIPLYQLLMIFFVQRFNMDNPPLPTSGWVGGPEYKIMPVVILAAAGMGYYARLTRTVMLEVLGQDYVRTARSKGLRERVVVYVHALRNAMLPLLTVIGPSLAFIVNGAFVVELLMVIPGIGFISVNSITTRDWPVVQATVMILALAVVVMNFLTDIAYSVVDPRIRLA